MILYITTCMILITIGNNWERVVGKIQAGLNSFQEWCVNNGMKLNIKKSKSLVIGTPHNLANLDLDNRFVLNDVFLERVRSYNYMVLR